MKKSSDVRNKLKHASISQQPKTKIKNKKLKGNKQFNIVHVAGKKSYENLIIDILKKVNKRRYYFPEKQNSGL